LKLADALTDRLSLVRAWPNNVAISIFCVAFGTQAYFWNAQGWAQNARLMPMLSFVEPARDQFTFRIDHLVRRGERRDIATGDWTLHDDHYYSNKAPGTHLLGTPVYLALFHAERLLGLEARSRELTQTNKGILNLWCTVTWTALAAALLYRFLLARGASPAGAIFGSAGYALGTLVFPFGTSLWGHTTSAAFLLIATCLLFWPGGVRATALCGFCAGLAVLTDYTASLPGACLALAALARVDRRALVRLAAGAAIPLATLLIYQKLCFGGFLTTSVAQTNPTFVEPDKLVGVLGLPNVTVLVTNLVSPYRGLLLYCPVLAFALPGAILAWREGHKALVAVSVSAILAILLLASSFNGWWAGWATGPRYLIVSIPFWCLLLPDIGGLRSIVRLPYVAAMALSCFNMTLIAAVEVMLDPSFRNPLYGFIYPRFLAGRYPHLPSSFNAGSKIFGLPPLWDLAPLAVVLGAWIVWCAWVTRRHVSRQHPVTD
jgi:hypothetical protein